MPSRSEASTSSAFASACVSSPCFPRTGSRLGPTEMTSAPSSCRRITGTQYSKSSNPWVTSTATFLPVNLIELSLLFPGAVLNPTCHRYTDLPTLGIDLSLLELCDVLIYPQ